MNTLFACTINDRSTALLMLVHWNKQSRLVFHSGSSTWTL